MTTPASSRERTSVDFRRKGQAPSQQSRAEVPSYLDRRGARGARERAQVSSEVVTPSLALAQLAEQRCERTDFGDRVRVACDLLLEVGQLGFKRTPAVLDLGA